jgi:CHAT domain-containing protein
VSYITQLELADLLTPHTPVGNAPLLALANPDGSLPAASREVRELARIRSGATSLEGPQATKERFVGLVSQFADVHLATHGVLDSERPERSYLLMAGADEASQRLSVAEIASLSLARNGLAVLSACETALGEQVPGAALITIAAAFSQAGAQSIVASLWKVDDAATRDFMVSFHRGLASAGRMAALQHAQLAVLGNPKTAHPYYWAAFILIGAR